MKQQAVNKWCPLFFILLWSCSGLSITPKQITYLNYFGYLDHTNPHSGSLKTQESLKISIKEFQRFAKLPITGEIDEATKKKFEQPRCGIKDIVKKESGRERRYVLQGSIWHKKRLTYTIENWTNDLSKKEVLQTIQSALMKWQRVSRLTFRYVPTGNADIKIRFTRKNHGDRYAFDGPGGVLAHAFYPGFHPLSGDTHFDDDETFTLKSKKGKNLYWVALHEFGHALGLDHTDKREAIMYPWYADYNGNEVDLSDDDKRGLQALYGKPKTPTKKPIQLDQCIEGVQAVYQNHYGDTIAINGEKVYIYDRKLQQKRSPIPIREIYPGLESIDAIYKYLRKTIILHDDRILRYGVLGRGGTEKNFGHGISNVDAALYFKRSGKVYLFKGEMYWRYNPSTNRIDEGYPKPIKDNWVGVPNDIDAAFVWNSKIYFFKGDQYYRFNLRRRRVRENYPRHISKFFICRKRVIHGKIRVFKQDALSSSHQNIPLVRSLLFGLVLLLMYVTRIH